MKKRSKKYVEALSKFDKSNIYTKEEAVKLVKETSTSSFDGSIEIAMRLNLDTKKADQQLRGAIVLPKGTGKTKKVLVVTRGPKAQEAKDAGADYVGDTDMLEKIEKENWFDFDTIIATPDMMPLLGKLGKVLGPKGLMPNPKTGTVTMDIKKAVEEVKAGRVEYRTDSFGNVHGVIGKVSFSEEDLLANLDAFVGQILRIKPATVKGEYIKNISISATMGPGIKVENNFDKLKRFFGMVLKNLFMASLNRLIRRCIMASEKILSQKQVVIDEIKERAQNAKTIVLFDYRGITDAESKELRTKLKETNSDYKVYKNTLMTRAFNDLGIDLTEGLTGPSAFAFGDDQIAPIKVLSEFAKEHPALVLKVGIVDGEKADQAKLAEYATLPSREQLLTMLAGGMIGIVRDLSICLDLYSQQKEEN